MIPNNTQQDLGGDPQPARCELSSPYLSRGTAKGVRIKGYV